MLLQSLTMFTYCIMLLYVLYLPHLVILRGVRAWKNKIPVYSPALTDGSIGDMIYFHSYTNPGLILDIGNPLPSLYIYITR